VARRRIGYDLQALGPATRTPVSRQPSGGCAGQSSMPVPTATSYSHCFKLMKIGPLVGKRTWGGVIRHLAAPRAGRRH